MDETSRTPNARRHALGWLAHPVSVGALLTMAVNDHLLKQAHGTWWTGKLSDVAGLIFFPALVAVTASLVVPRWHPRRVAVVALTLTGVGFAWVKATAVGATTASAVLSALAGPSHVWRDPTDLLALPALAGAAWTARHVLHKPRTLRRALTIATLPAALVASVATSYIAPNSYEAAVAVDGTLYALQADRYDSEWVVWGRAAEAVTLGRDTLDAALRDAPRCTADAQSCFRPAPDGRGVDISYDGGATWRRDLKISDAQWRLLSLRQDKSVSPGTDPFTTATVTVGELNGEETVIAANGVDGLAIRDANGRWYRLGWDGTTESMASHLAIPRSAAWNRWLTVATLGWTWVIAYGVVGAASVKVVVPRPVPGSDIAWPGGPPDLSPQPVLTAAPVSALGSGTFVVIGLLVAGGGYSLARESNWLFPLIASWFIALILVVVGYSLAGLMFRVRVVDAVLLPVAVAAAITTGLWWLVHAPGMPTWAVSAMPWIGAVLAALAAWAITRWTTLPRRSSRTTPTGGTPLPTA